MEIDLDRLKNEGEAYVVSVMESVKTEAWDNLRAQKFPVNTPEELEIMRAIWNHGFTRGAEAASRMMTKMAEQTKELQPKLWTPQRK